MKVGDYVRTKHGYIGIYTEKEEIERVPDWNGGWKDEKILYQLINGSRFFEDKIIKSSPNIIDLIEVGDYVNGHLVFDKTPKCVYIEDSQNKLAHIPYTKKNIESVLTKEQFESTKYKVGEDK